MYDLKMVGFYCHWLPTRVARKTSKKKPMFSE